MTTPTNPAVDARASFVILAAVFVAAVCGLLYELIAGTLSSYLLGDSVTQFSVVIGLFLTAMGVGSLASRLIRRRLVFAFIAIELAIGILGGFTAPAGFLAFAFTEVYVPVLLGCVITIGVLVGLEIPLVLRILEETRALRINVANVFAADYIGALAASLVFPFFLLPHVGLIRAGLIAGLANVVVAGILWRSLRNQLGSSRRLLGALILTGATLLGAGIVAAGHLVPYAESRLYQDDIIFASDSPAQRIVVTHWRDDVRLFLDGHLQFSSVDEVRYHESLAHPTLAAAERRSKILILGGGDGLLLREVLRDSDVRQVDLVDLDPEVLHLFREHSLLTRLNQNSLADPRATIHAGDAYRYLEETDQLYDVILIDLPDPSREGLEKLYSRSFYRLALRRLAVGGAIATQATSPYRSRQAFWCIAQTLEATTQGVESPRSLHVYPYHTVVPTFGTWGFVLATDRPLEPQELQLRVPTRYLTPELLPTLFVFPADMSRVETKVHDLAEPVLGRYYREGYHRYLK